MELMDENTLVKQYGEDEFIKYHYLGSFPLDL